MPPPSTKMVGKKKELHFKTIWENNTHYRAKSRVGVVYEAIS